jgi:GAF domain-containing protein
LATSEDPIRESLAALSRFFIGDSTMGDTLQRVIDLAVVAVPPAAYTGISMLVDDVVTTSVFSDAEVAEIDETQYKAGTGPCLDAFRDGVVNVIRSTERDVRWPEFSRRAFDHGVRSSLSLPLLVGDDSVGALNFYSRQEDAFTDEDQQNGQTFAVQAAVVLANAQAYWDARTLGERLGDAMHSRAAIEQAKGILMAQSHIDPDAAFDLLRAASQRENRKLRDIAQELVDRHTHGETSP